MTVEEQEFLDPPEPESSEEAENEESAPQEAEAETDESAGDETEQDGEDAVKPEQDEEAEEKKPKKDKVQRRIDRITKEKREAEERAKWIESENARLKKELAERQGGKDSPPLVEEFENFDDFADALADWKAEKKLEEARSNDAKKAAEEAKKASRELLAAQLDQGRAKYEDFDRVATATPLDGGPTITSAMLDVMQESPIMADIAYYFGKNPDESVRISGLSHIAQVREIVLLEQKIINSDIAKPKKVTKAPTPIKPVGSSAVVTKAVAEMTDHEYAEWRRKGR